MSGQVHGKFIEPTDVQGAMAHQEASAKTEDPGTQTIQSLAFESLSMGSEELLPESTFNASLDTEDFETMEQIDSIRSEYFGEADSEMEDLAAMLGMDMDEVDDIMSNNDLASMLGIDETDLEEFQELVFEGEVPDNIDVSDQFLREARIDVPTPIAIVKDINTEKRFFLPFHDEYIMNHPDAIEATFNGTTLTAKEGTDLNEILDLLWRAEVDMHVDIESEMIESLMSGRFEFITLSEAEWDSHIKSLYINILGIKIDNLAQKTFEKSDSDNVEVDSLEDYTFQEYKMIGEFDLRKLEVSLLLPKIVMNGIFSKLLTDIQSSLNELNQIKKNEEKQEIQRQVLINFIKLKLLLAEVAAKSEKKEKIWLENTTSFLRFLLRRDIKKLFKQKGELKDSSQVV